MGNRGHETAGTGHRGRGNGNGNGVTVTKQIDVIGLLVRILLSGSPAGRMQVYINIFVEHKFRKSRPCIILLYIRIDGLQNLK